MLALRVGKERVAQIATLAFSIIGTGAAGGIIVSPAGLKKVAWKFPPRKTLSALNSRQIAPH